MLKIAEVFGPTWQGEGRSLGRRCAFIRVSRCNLACSWCDTPYTWDWEGQNGVAYKPSEEQFDGDVEELYGQVVAMGVDMVVITGGEPMVQQRSLMPLLEKFDDAAIRVEVETNGTLAPLPDFDLFVDQYNVSPKLSNSHQPENKRIVPDALIALNETGKASFKFVVTNPDDMTEIDDIMARCEIHPSDVWIMGEGRSIEDVDGHAQSVIIDALERGFNMTTRLHVMLWGDRRGV